MSDTRDTRDTRDTQEQTLLFDILPEDSQLSIASFLNRWDNIISFILSGYILTQILLVPQQVNELFFILFFAFIIWSVLEGIVRRAILRNTAKIESLLARIIISIFSFITSTILFLFTQLGTTLLNNGSSQLSASETGVLIFVILLYVIALTIVYSAYEKARLSLATLHNQALNKTIEPFGWTLTGNQI